MSRYRLLPTPAQEAVLRDHCAHKSAPGYLEQCRQLTEARAGHDRLAVTAREGDGAARPVNREPQLLLLPA